MSNRTFVGFGFGPIQSALFLFEAFTSGNFRRHVVTEVDPELVRALRANNGDYTINIARKDRIDQVTISGIDAYNPRDAADRDKIIDAIAEADEMATALPSVSFYDAGDQAGVAAILGAGLSRRASKRQTVVYAAENHNHAAEILRESLNRYAPASSLEGVQILNTVIGKMSGVIGEPETIARLGLSTMTPRTPRAILVEEFNRILISRVKLDGFRRGIEVFVEKDDLLPFEECKLYGHNAIHALIGYLADLKHLQTMAEAGADREIMSIARTAFLEESGAALIRQYGGMGDALFTPQGFAEYADDLLDRMVRPNLNDLIVRVIRDPLRKLSYDDRLYGTMRLALRHGITPRNMARGAAAAVLAVLKRRDAARSSGAPLPGTRAGLTERQLRELLMGLWAGKSDHHADTLVKLTWEAMPA